MVKRKFASAEIFWLKNGGISLFFLNLFYIDKWYVLVYSMYTLGRIWEIRKGKVGNENPRNSSFCFRDVNVAFGGISAEFA